MITRDMLVQYYELNKQKKEIEMKMNELKNQFQDYFDNLIGSNHKGEVTISGYKLQRQVRKTERFNEETTVKRLEELQLHDLILTVKKPDDAKIKAALSLGLLKEEQLEGCMITSLTPAISVKPLVPR
ncbi:hypothetical protein [Neobacillus sp. LXY-1]|uniref:hypothetical protein n=1 Tax=Neobacillus sp. LXY-1 TaxID=3379133 RepID=UPI003EDFF4CD